MQSTLRGPHYVSLFNVNSAVNRRVLDGFLNEESVPPDLARFVVRLLAIEESETERLDWIKNIGTGVKDLFHTVRTIYVFFKNFRFSFIFFCSYE
jgi:hypothetical protein